jgi:peptidyl-prolyl cis-trans isomerase SurA
MSIREVVPEFAAVASRMPIGQYSPVFETAFGLHFLRVNERRGDQIDYNHILIMFDETKSDPAEAINRLSAVRDSVIAGQGTFSEMARRHSEEEQSRLQGGRVQDPQSGERELFLDALGPDWQETVRVLQPGEISEPGPIQLLDGRLAYHIVLLQARIPEHRVSIETDYPLIQQYALREKQNSELNAWLDDLRTEVFIDVRMRAADDNVSIN